MAANTFNILIDNTWRSVAGTGSVAVTAIDPSDRVEFAITSNGSAPAPTLSGHFVPRADDLYLALSEGEILWLRSSGSDQQLAVVTADTPST